MLKVWALLIASLILPGCTELDLSLKGGRPIPIERLAGWSFDNGPVLLSIGFQVDKSKVRAPTGFRYEAVSRQENYNILKIVVYEVPSSDAVTDENQRFHAGVSLWNQASGVYRIVDGTTGRTLETIDTATFSSLLSPLAPSAPRQPYSGLSRW